MQPLIVGVAVANATRLQGTSGIDVTWDDLQTDPGGTAATFRTLFGEAHQNFRRLDRAARLLSMACEAAGVSALIPQSARADTALVIETELGCLQTDLAFAASLRAGLADSSAFPYTLANTSLGELAIRYGFRGPTLCLSVEPGQDGLACAEAARLLEDGDARFAVVGRVECLAKPFGDWPPVAHAIVAVLAVASDNSSSADDSIAVTPWPDLDQAAFTVLAEHVRRACGQR